MEFIDWLETQNIHVQFINIPVSMLKSTQNEINLKKVENLSANLPEKALNKPLIISKDLFVLDGHHRWLAILNRDPHFLISAYRVNLPIYELLEITRKYRQTFSRPSTQLSTQQTVHTITYDK
jgi:hypothetical protein